MPVPDEEQIVNRSLLREQAYRVIRDAIVDGTLAPEERLHDTELVRWLGVSRTPVREALMRLEQSGLVLSKPGRYTMVSPLDLRQTREAQSVAAALHELAVREAVPLLSSAEIEAMAAANERFAAALRRGDVDAALAADDEFHEVAVTASANAMTRDVLERVTPLLRRVERLQFSSLAGRRSVAQHEEIIRLCRAGDTDKASVATRANWQTLQLLLGDAALRDQDGR